MADVIDISKVIRGSTSEMTIDSLTKKGVKQVKVLDQATITRLISQVIDKVLTERAEQVDASERERIIQETKDQLNVGSLKKGIQAANDEIAHKDRRISELQGQLEAKEEQLTDQRDRGDGGLAQVLTLLTTQMQQGASAGGATVAAAIESLTKKIDSMPAGGGGDGGGANHNAPVPDEVALDFLTSTGDSFESNIDTIEVKQAKAGDVKGALDKLKKLQKGGE